MAIIHRAELVPSMRSVLQAWLPQQPWFAGIDVATLELIGTYRFDDPVGEVGIEGHLLRADSVVLHVPMTYRSGPLSGADDHLLAIMEHSVLGRRWAYDAGYDPAAVAVITDAIREGRPGAELEIQGETGVTRSTPVQVCGSGGASADPLQVLSVLDLEATVERPSLTGRWAGQSSPVVLARL